MMLSASQSIAISTINERLISCLKGHAYLNEKFELSESKPQSFHFPELITSINQAIKDHQDDSAGTKETLKSIKGSITAIKVQFEQKQYSLFVRIYWAVLYFFTGRDPLQAHKNYVTAIESLLERTIENRLGRRGSPTKPLPFPTNVFSQHYQLPPFPKESETADIQHDTFWDKEDLIKTKSLPQNITTLRLTHRNDITCMFSHMPRRFSRFIFNDGEVIGNTLVFCISPPPVFFVDKERVVIDSTKDISAGFLSVLHIYNAKTIVIRGKFDTHAVIELLLRTKVVQEVDLSEARDLSTDVLGLLGTLSGLKVVKLPKKLECSDMGLDKLPKTEEKGVINWGSSRETNQGLEVVIHPNTPIEKLYQVRDWVKGVAPNLKYYAER